MNDSRNDLIEKFRANLRARVQKVRDMLDILKQIPDNAEATSQVAGELHTLKGEARLLGLVQLSQLAHALETVLREIDARAIAAAESALEVMARALMEQVSRDDADKMLAAATKKLETDSEVLESPTRAAEIDSPSDKGPSGEVVAPAVMGGSARWVQVDAGHIDQLCEMMAALSGEFGRIIARVSHLSGAAGRAGPGMDTHEQESLLLEECTRFRTTLDNATVHTWALRMVPAQPLLRELAAHARQLASAAGKDIAVTVDAAGVQIERDALDKIWDAMIHLVRNSIDHGLESPEERGSKGAIGNLSISARTIGTSVTVEVADDGRGIDVNRVRNKAVARGMLDSARAEQLPDREVIRLLFEHGFSTVDEVSALSGRGVGLDVVKSRVESLGGGVDVQSTLGLGTRFSITLPFTLTKERLMVFELAGGLYGLPTQAIHALVGWRDLPDTAEGGQHVVRVDGEPVPLVSLAELLGREREPCSAALVVSLQELRYGLLVARVLGVRELIRRPAEPLLVRATEIGASAMMEDGRVVLVLDLVKMAQRVRHATNGRDRTTTQHMEPNAVPRVLFVDDSPVIREMVSEILASAGLLVTTASDGEEALSVMSAGEPDLVVSDIEMPRMDGFALLERIRRRSQRLPVVMLTTRASLQDRQRATTLGANAYVLKEDFKSAVLLDVIQRFVPIHR